MRILILNYEFPPIGGGGGVATKIIGEMLVEHGVDIDLLTSSFQNTKLSKSTLNIYQVPAFGRKSLQTSNSISMFSYILFGLIKYFMVLRKNEYDCIYSHFAIPSGVLGTIISRVTKRRHIINIYGGDIYDPSKKSSPHRNKFFNIVVTNILNNCNYIISDSKDLLARLRSYYRVSTKQIAFPIPYASKNRIQTANKKLVKYKLITVSRLVSRKRVEIQIKLLKQLGKEYSLTIIGNGPEKDNLFGLAQKLNIIENVDFVGHVSDKRKYALLNSSDMFLLTSSHEGFGIVIQEAMEHGLALAVTQNVGILDFLKINENYIQLTDNNLDSNVAQIKKFFRSNENIQKMSKQNFKDIQLFSPDQLINKYMKVLHE